MGQLLRSHLHRLFHFHHPKIISIHPFQKHNTLQPFVAHLSLHHHNTATMSSAVSNSKVAVVGCGISGAVCASTLARNGVSVTVFESGRGPAGRMSRRREMTEDGKELFFDHGAPFFTVTSNHMTSLVCEWEEKGLVAEWKQSFGSFDYVASEFVEYEKEGSSKKYVGTPGMNSICRAMCSESGVETKFGTTVGKLEWMEDKNLWLLIDLEGNTLGHFDAVVASDKNVVCPRVTAVAGRPPPLDMMTLAPKLALKLQEVPVFSCFALMLAFPVPLSSIPVKGFSFKNSDVLSWAFCDNSKPGRPITSECWVLHSTAEYAKRVITKNGLQKPSSLLLSKVAEDLFHEFESTKLNIPRPLFMKAHRWGSAFPAIAVAGEEKCLYDSSKKLAICGDFCVSPNVEGAVLSGLGASAKILELA